MKEGGVNVQVVNASWGGPTATPALREKLDELVELGIVIVASAGNGGEDLSKCHHYPASWADGTQILAVAASREKDGIYSDSNYGDTKVHLAAPGFEVLTTALGGGHQLLYGTSFAAPHVSGAIALTMAACPTLSARDAAALILSEADPVPGLAPFMIGGRRLAVGRAIAKCVSEASLPQRASSLKSGRTD
jgi:subtilisin family serine protease